MNLKNLFFLSYLGLYSLNLFATDTTQIKKNRVIIVSSTLASSLVGSYYYVQNSWWSEKQSSFHFDNGADLTYALNVDKAGHVMGGLIASDIFSSSMKWAGMQKKQALWYGAAFGSGLQLAIEMKDAYAPYWGFSKWDLALGTTGAFWPVAQHYAPFMNAINIKFSYYKRSNIYWELDEQRGKTTNKYAWQDDYPNQTYWLSFDVNYFIDTKYWPSWLNIGLGYGIDDSQYLDVLNKKNGGKNEVYIALDYDIPKLLKRWNNPTAKKVKHWLNYFHFPAPTIRITPKLKFYPVFL